MVNTQFTLAVDAFSFRSFAGHTVGSAINKITTVIIERASKLGWVFGVGLPTEIRELVPIVTASIKSTLQEGHLISQIFQHLCMSG